MTQNIFLVTDSGASPESPDNTAAFQRAIDRTARSGGRLVVPRGTFRLGRIELKSRVELHLSRGARLQSLLKPEPEAGVECADPSCNRRNFLIGARGIEDAAVTGPGVIDGRGAEHFWEIDPEATYALFGRRYTPRPHRPKGLLHFRESRHIRIEDVTILDAPCYAVWLLGCREVAVTGVKIRAPLSSPNTDGLDIDCCRRVLIRNCDIATGDDAIALKSDIDALGYDQACCDVEISGCRLKSSSCGIRAGYEGDGEIRDCIVRDCVIHGSMIGISLMAVTDPANPRGILVKRGAPIHGLVFERLALDAWQSFNFQHVADPRAPLQGKIDHIIIRDVHAQARRGSYIGGLASRTIGEVRFDRVFMQLSGRMGTDFSRQLPEPYPLWNDLAYSGIPCAIYARHADRLLVHDSTFFRHRATGAWRPEALWTEAVAELSLRGNREVAI